VRLTNKTNKFLAKTMAEILQPFIASLNTHTNSLVVSLSPIKDPRCFLE